MLWCSGRRCATDLFFFFNDTATTEIYTLSLHDALPIFDRARGDLRPGALGHHLQDRRRGDRGRERRDLRPGRSEEHTSELQSRLHLVCRLLLEKKKADVLWLLKQRAERRGLVTDTAATV